MTKGKIPRYDEIPIEFFKQLRPIIGHNFYQMILMVY